MKRRNTILILTIGVLVIAAVLGANVYRNANAQASTPAAPTTNQSANIAAAHPGFGKGLRGVYDNTQLATALGITTDELTAAYQKANTAALAKAVEAGLITQAQADAMTSRGMGMPFGGHKGGWLNKGDIDFDALLADALGITVDKLQAAYATAFSANIDQSVTDGAITQEQADLMKGRYALNNDKGFQTAMQSANEAAVAQAVSDGVITQAQADLILAEQAGHGFGGFGPQGFGMDGDRGGRHGGWDGGAPGLPPVQ